MYLLVLVVVVAMKKVAVAVAMAISAVVGHLISSRCRNFMHQDDDDINKDYGKHKTLTLKEVTIVVVLELIIMAVKLLSCGSSSN